MKFSHYLKSVDEDAPSSLKGRFLNYKKLKKFIKYRSRRIELASRGVHMGLSAHHLIQSSQQEVAQMLQEELLIIDQTFEHEANGTIATFDALQSPRPNLLSLFRSSTGKSTSNRQDIWAWRAAADRAGWALRYARLNVLALRKIVKKHDKVMRSHFGQEFLQRCYHPESQLRFLSGPLHAEMAAVQALAQHPPVSGPTPAQSGLTDALLDSSRIDEAGSEEGEAGSRSGVSTPGGSTGRGANTPTTAAERTGNLITAAAAALRPRGGQRGVPLADEESQLTCPTCKGPLFDPAALLCNHIVCGRCTIAAAGHAGACTRVRDLERLRATPGACCPVCRARQSGPYSCGFFQATVPLPHLAQLVCKRFPAQWSERMQQDKETRNEAGAVSRLFRLSS